MARLLSVNVGLPRDIAWKGRTVHTGISGLGAARLAASHYSVMTKSSAMFVAGPPVVARVGQDLSKQELGGWEIQTRSGAVDHAVDTEEEAFTSARRFLSYLPSSVHELPPKLATDDDPERRDESLMQAIPNDRRKVYKVRPIIEAVVDRGSFFEMGTMFGRAIVTGLARLDGRAVAVMASDPYFYGGSWTAAACQKIVRFVDLAETFHLPVVYLMDCPGFLIGLEAERAATPRSPDQKSQVHEQRGLQPANLAEVFFRLTAMKSNGGIDFVAGGRGRNFGDSAPRGTL